MRTKTPVIVVAGYLGAGKTTLLRRLLEKPDRKIAVLVNEFGEIGIDSKIVRGSNVEMRELLGGCVCCSLTGEFQAAIEEIRQKVDPDVILVETTGVAEPDAVVVGLEGVSGVHLQSVVTVVDSDALLKFPKLGHTGRVQIEAADVILLNKLDLLSPGEIEEVLQAVRRINPSAKVVETTFSNVEPEVVFGSERYGGEERKERGLHEPSFTDSFVYESGKVLDRARFVQFVSRMPRGIYRAKGHVEFPNGSYLFNFVNGRFDFSDADGEKTRLVFIGDNAWSVKDEVLDGVRACEM